MVKNYATLFLVFIISLGSLDMKGQDAPVLTFNIPAQNNLRYNRFLLNPTFSFVRENNTNISLFHRNQWVQFDDSPKVYMLAYSGKFTERSGLGFGIYQQNLGVISSFGGVANYSYNVRILQKMNVTLGFNLAYYNSGVNNDRVITEEPDPVLLAMRNNSLLSIKPGINIGYGDFDLSAYAENFIEYDFKSTDMVKKYSDKTVSGFIMYTHQMDTKKSLLENGELRLALGGRSSELNDFGINASAMVDFPKIGWFQTSIDDFYGIGLGAGFHLTKRLSLGYTFERAVKEGIVNLGPTHEFTMVFAIRDRLVAERADALQDTLQLSGSDSLHTDEVKLVKDTAEKKGDTIFDKDAELEKLRLELNESSMHLLDALVKEDSLANIKKTEFEKKVRNLMEYAQREKEAKKITSETEPIVLKSLKKGDKINNPKTLEDLDKAVDGYYVISEKTKVADGENPLVIEHNETFPQAVKSLEKKKMSSQEKDPYIIHVDNIVDNETEHASKTISNEEKLQPTAKAVIDQEKAKREADSKTEKEIRDYYSTKTSKPRSNLQKVNKLTIEDMEPGYYIIANVFSDKENAKKFVRDLKDKGVKAKVFFNPKNNFSYVYLEKHSRWKDVLVSYYSNVNNTYFEPVWIISVNTD